MDYKFFAWVSVGLFVLILSPFIANFINRHFIKSKSESFRNGMKVLRKVHKPAGLLFAISAIVHGYMVMGGRLFVLHSGTLLYASLLLTVILGGIFYKKKKPQLFKAHKIMAGITALLFLLHFFVPGIF